MKFREMFLSSQSASLFPLAAYFCIFIIHSTSGQSNSSSYCSISSCTPRQQTICLFPSSTPSSECTNYNSSGLMTRNDSIAIMRRHNFLRRKVARGEETLGNPGPQPPASDMKLLKWDAELALVAQRYADQCLSGHDTCRNVERFTVGQNIATFWTTGEMNHTVEDLMQGWYDEVEQFSKDNVPRYRFDPSYGHYSQLVWGNTSFLGCGRVIFFDRNRMMNCTRLICNYGPAGNFIGRPVYTIGPAGSACPSGISNKTSSLCD